AVRHLDRLHQLGEERAHSLAIQALSLSAHCLAAIVPRGVVCPDLEQCSVRWREGSIPILDVHRFVVEDEQSCGALPHSWSTTSDSLAARVARVAGLKRLILLKSVTIPRELSWKEAGQLGFVDPQFSEAAASLTVQALNFRAACA